MKEIDHPHWASGYLWRVKRGRPSNLQDHAVRPAREAAAMARKMGDKQPGKPREGRRNGGEVKVTAWQSQQKKRQSLTRKSRKLHSLKLRWFCWNLMVGRLQLPCGARAYFQGRTVRFREGKKQRTGWWFQRFFSPPFWLCFFSMGWNHQLENKHAQKVTVERIWGIIRVDTCIYEVGGICSHQLVIFVYVRYIGGPLWVTVTPGWLHV